MAYLVSDSYSRDHWETDKKMKKIGLIGGAYNPVTKGHIAVAQYVLNHNVVEQIWLVPCMGHLFGKNMANAAQRIEMCRLAAKVDDRIKVCTYEITHFLKGSTYDFLQLLLATNHDANDPYEFSYIIGLDNANEFDKWVNYEKLQSMIRFIVVSRQGVKRDTKVDWYLKPPHIFLNPDKGEVPECSSTEAIKLLGLSCHGKGLSSKQTTRLLELLDREVIEYIFNHSELYI